jgi:hypothetical protein
VHRRTIAATAIGGAIGAFGALAVLALAATRVITDGVGAVVLNEASGRSRPEFVVTEGGLTILVIVAGALAGAFFGGLGYLVNRAVAPEERRFRVWTMVGAGAATGIVAAYAATRIGLGIGSDITGGVVTLSIFRATIIALATGIVTGGVVAGGIERLSSVEVMGLEGEAVQPSAMALAREAAAAMGFPLLAALLAAGIVGGLGLLLLEMSAEVALITFGAAAAVVLGVAAFMAANPPRRRDQ